jgi:hypothetical protein
LVAVIKQFSLLIRCTGVDALLCCSSKPSSSDIVPKEQQINVEKLRPGSGMLLVKVLADGPTRALRISDVRQQV